MNFGIINNRRPDKGASGETARNPLLNDVRMREIAKQMGLEPKDFGKEAMNLWNMLDEMAENDPKAYTDFINEQLKHGPPTKPGSEDVKPKFFNPEPGLVVKCTMQSTSSTQDQKLFLNLCAHELIDMPKNPNSNKEVPRDTRAVPTTNNLQIPLVVGALREIKDFTGAKCHAIDVVFHPWVIERCQWDASFKRDVLQLAIQWVQEDAKIKLVPPMGKFIKSLYKGGVTMGNEIITAKFLIEPDQQQTGTLADHANTPSNQEEAESKMKTERPSSTKLPIQSPSDLLKQMSLNDEDSSGASSDFLIKPVGEEAKPRSLPAATKPPMAPAKKQPLIQVIEPKSDNQIDHELSTKPSAKKKSSVVKRGFLNSAKTPPLYPKGSSEGRPPSAYVNLLSRSKVVDLSQVEQQKQQQTATQRERDAFLRSLEPQSTNKNMTATQEKDHGDFEFERLCMEADPDLQLASDRHAHTSSLEDPTRELFGEHLDEFAKFLTSQSA